MPLSQEMWYAHAKAIESTSVAEGFGLRISLNPGYLVKGLCDDDMPEMYL